MNEPLEPEQVVTLRRIKDDGYRPHNLTAAFLIGAEVLEYDASADCFRVTAQGEEVLRKAA